MNANPLTNITGLHVTLWALGVIFATVGWLVRHTLLGISRQIDENSKDTKDTNDKVTRHGETLAELKGVVPEVERLRVKVDKLGEDVAHLGGADALANKLVEGVTAIARASAAQAPRRKR